MAAAGLPAWNLGDWSESRNEAERALEVLRAHCPEAVWESTLAYATFLRSLFYQGEIGEICRRVPELVEDAHSRGDLFCANVLLVTGGYIYYLAMDRPDQARQQMEHQLQDWEAHGFHSTRNAARLGLVETALYEGDSETAWRIAHQRQTLLLRLAVSRASTFSVYLLSQRGRSALARAVADSSNRKKLLDAVRRNADAIAKQPMSYAQALAGLLRAGAFSVGGEHDSALRCLTECEQAFYDCGMAMHAAVCRLRHGQFTGGETGSALAREAEEALRSRHIVNPARLAAMLAPGAWDK